MGDIADMMLEGFLDEETGEVIDGDAPGFPRSMSRGPDGIDPALTMTRKEVAQQRLTESRKRKNKAKKLRQKANRKARAAAAEPAS